MKRGRAEQRTTSQFQTHPIRSFYVLFCFNLLGNLSYPGLRVSHRFDVFFVCNPFQPVKIVQAAKLRNLEGSDGSLLRKICCCWDSNSRLPDSRVFSSFLLPSLHAGSYFLTEEAEPNWAMQMMRQTAGDAGKHRQVAKEQFCSTHRC